MYPMYQLYPMFHQKTHVTVRATTRIAPTVFSDRLRVLALGTEALQEPFSLMKVLTKMPELRWGKW